MASYPVEIRRCQHVSANGTQCGSPALKGKDSCYYHEQSKWEEVPSYADWDDPYGCCLIKLPSFDDAHSIQFVIRQVTILLMQKRIDPKVAGLMLYGCQIAGSNLKRMAEEKPQPTQIVVEPEKVGETPMGMTPWSASGEGHDPEPDDDNYEDDGYEEDDDEDDGPSYEELEKRLRKAWEERAEKHTYSEQVIATCRIDARNRAMRIREALKKETTFEGLQKVMAEVARLSEIETRWENWAQGKLLPLDELQRTLARPVAASG